jgi:hypothetical protein
MVKRVVVSAVFAAGLFAISAGQRTDDPYPCPDCDPNSGNGPIVRLADTRTDDPYPCPDCDPNSGNGPIVRLAGRL